MYHNHFMALFSGTTRVSRWPVPEENFWTLWCKGRLTEVDTNHPSGRHSIRTNQCPPPLSPHFLQAGCSSCHPTNSIKALVIYCHLYDWCDYKHWYYLVIHFLFQCYSVSLDIYSSSFHHVMSVPVNRLGLSSAPVNGNIGGVCRCLTC